MDPLVRDYAGAERKFRLRLRDMLDLETACARPIADIYMAVTSSRYRVDEIRHTLIRALVGGGLSATEATKLVTDRFDVVPLIEHALLAAEVMIATMTGIEASEASAPTSSKPVPAEPMKYSQVGQWCQVFHMTPDELMAMPWADFVNLIRGYNAAKAAPALEAPSEEEFEDMIRRHEG
jgi:hypothetical protein